MHTAMYFAANASCFAFPNFIILRSVTLVFRNAFSYT